MVRERRMCETNGVMKQEGSKCEAGECGGMVRERGEVRTKRERDEDKTGRDEDKTGRGEDKTGRGEDKTGQGEDKTGESREWADNEMRRQ